MKILSVSKMLPVLAVLTAAQMGRAQAPAVPDAAPAAGQNAAAAGRAGAAGAANGAAGAARGGGRGGAPRIVGGVGDINKDDPAYANFDWAPKLDYVKVKTPADEQKEFILQQGYRMDPVLTDADGIKEPTNIAFDGNGRMFVMEDRGYMLTIDAQHQREPNGLISMHEDTNNDGVYDKHTVFIDKLVFPRFMLPYGPNALLVMETDADEVWKYTDTNGDGKADKKELFVTGVGQSGNVEHQQGLLMEAMDNWLYMTVKAFRLRQLPNGTVLRETTGSNGAQWGVSQDNDGKLWFQGGASGVPSYWNYPIVYGNFAPQNPLEGDFTIAWGAPVRIMDAQQGMKDVRMPDGSLTRVTGSAGSNWVRANRMPADLQGHYLYNEPVGRMIRRIQPVISEGVTTLKNYYNGNEFVKSTDPLFRPVNLATAPDGTIYVVDMYRGIIQESTWSAPVNTYLRARVDEYGLDRFHSMGRIWRLSYDQLPRDKTMPKMNNESAAQLVTHLNHPNGWWRDTAQQLLVLKQDKSVVPALKKMVTDTKGDVVPRMHALWTLEGLGSLDAALTRSMMADSNPRMRSQAIRASETLYKGGDKTFAADYAKLAKDANTDVSIQALLTMNLLKTPDTATVAKAVMDANKAKGIQLVAGQILNPAAAGGGRGGRGGPTGPTLDAAQQASVTRGQATFAELCSQCHGADATGANKPDNSGKLAPSLANNARVSGHRDWMLNVLVHGLTGPIPGSEVKDIMVPMGSNKDEWIADVASYVRINFGNTGSVVTPQNVAQIRAATPGRTTPWTFAELDARVPKATVSNLADWKVSASHNAATARNAISSFNTWTTGNTATQPAGDIWLQVELPAAINLAEVQFTSAGAAAGGGRGGAGGGRAGAAGGAAGGPAGGPVAANAGAQVLPAAAPAAAPAVQPVVAPVVSRELRVEVSTNGTAWTPVGTVKGADGSQTLALSQSTPAKFVRIVQVQGAPALTLSTLRLFELGGAR